MTTELRPEHVMAARRELAVRELRDEIVLVMRSRPEGVELADYLRALIDRGSGVPGCSDATLRELLRIDEAY
jgi:hypothetical protein